MRGTRGAAGLAVLAAVAAGCGSSSTGKPVDPAGDGSTRTPDVEVESLIALRTHKVEVRNDAVRPRLVSARVNDTVQFRNAGDRTVRVRKASGPGTTFRSESLEPGDSYGKSFLSRGRYVVDVVAGSAAGDSGGARYGGADGSGRGGRSIGRVEVQVLD